MSGIRSRFALTDALLAAIHKEILGGSTTLQQFGLRQSPVFVGESVHFQEVVHYIAPLLLPSASSTSTRWPMADGNGRVHRFLVNEVLQISELITRDSADRRACDRILEVVSRPLMDVMAGHYRFGKAVTDPDGLSSNLHITDPERARRVWRMPDPTRLVIDMAEVIARTIREDMRQESRCMRSHARARAAIKDVVEIPDTQVDRVIRSIQANQGSLTGALAKEIPPRSMTWQSSGGS